MDTPTHLVPHKTDGPLDGRRIVNPPGRDLLAVRVDDDGDVHLVPLVPTGDVVWEGDSPIEVWVPEDRLDEWRQENPDE